MAIAEVNRAFHGTTTSSTCIISLGATAAGDLIVIQVGWDANTVSITSVTDGVNTYVHASGSDSGTNGTLRADTWYAENIAGGNVNPTVNLSGTATHVVASAVEYSGAKASGSFQTGAFVVNAAGASVGPNLTPNTAGSLLVSNAWTHDFFYTGVSAPWNLEGHDDSVDGYAAADYINPPLSVQSAAFAPSTSGEYASSGAIFLPPASGPSHATKTGMFLVF